LGRAIVIVLKFNNQPRMTLILVSPVLALIELYPSIRVLSRERFYW
jgi:hypothetical protein